MIKSAGNALGAVQKGEQGIGARVRLSVRLAAIALTL